MKKILDNDKFSKRYYKWIFLFLLPAIVIFFMFYFIPILTTIYTSFTQWDGFNSPKFIFLENYKNLFVDKSFIYSMKNLFYWSILAGTVHVGFGVLVAFILNTQPFGWKFTRAVFMIPNVISMAAWAMIFKFLFNNDMGVFNTLIRKFIPDFNVEWLFTSPYAFWIVTLTWLFFSVIVTLIVLNDLKAIPTEMIEAARIDGATTWEIIRTIQLPMCRTAIGTSVIASITARVTMYESILLTTGGGPGEDTMNLTLMAVNNITDMNYGMANAIGVVMIAVGIFTLVLVNKLFRMNETDF